MEEFAREQAKKEQEQGLDKVISGLDAIYESKQAVAPKAPPKKPEKLPNMEETEQNALPQAIGESIADFDNYKKKDAFGLESGQPVSKPNSVKKQDQI